METAKRATRRSFVLISAVLLGALVLYYGAVSTWFWQDAAQIDAGTLAAAPCPRVMPNDPHFDQDEWCNFGSGNSAYNDPGQFWGSDYVSLAFSGLLKMSDKIAGPFVKAKVVPAWNEAMKPPQTRQRIGALISLFYSAVFGAWISAEIYPRIRRAIDKSVAEDN